MMDKLLKVRKVSDYSEYLGHKDTHPLISVIDYSELPPVRHCLCNYSVYGLFLRDDVAVDLTYGFGKYDYSEGTLICVAPGQIGGKEEKGELIPSTFQQDVQKIYRYGTKGIREQESYFCRYEQRYLGITPSYMHFCDFSKIVCKKTKGSFWLFHYLCNRKQ